MYVLNKETNTIECDVNGTVVARLNTDDGSISIRQGLEKKKVLKNIRMDLPELVDKYNINPEVDDPSLFGPLGDEGVDFVRKEYLPGETYLER